MSRPTSLAEHKARMWDHVGAVFCDEADRNTLTPAELVLLAKLCAFDLSKYQSAGGNE